MEKRFFEKVEKGAGCWEWLAKKNNKGYGMFNVDGVPGKFKTAHRISYEIAYGEIPKGCWVLHRCDNRGCVNPEHLFLGNNASNVNDMHSKGRGWGGIGPETAYSILWCHASGMSRKQNSAAHDVSVHAVKHIALRRTWHSLSQVHD